jgi:hypothetical protein
MVVVTGSTLDRTWPEELSEYGKLFRAWVRLGSSCCVFIRGRICLKDAFGFAD